MSFAQELCRWYEQYQRDLPWRHTRDPYLIWLSEIILQQTRVDQGLPYYLRFVEKYPTIDAFSAAAEDDVLQLWQGLGYYSRARNMLKAAHIISTDFHGIFPKKYDELILLPGIGEYTAAAISSFSNDEPRAVLDGNVFRVLSRYFGVELPINSPEGRRYFAQLASECLDSEHPAAYNQAIMEFGATWCKPKQPLCEHCMLRVNCWAYSHQKVALLPVKLKGKKTRDRFFHYFIYKEKDKIIMSKRGEGDVWQNLYEFPMIETPERVLFPEIMENETFLEEIGSGNAIQLLQSETKHILSHQHIYATFYLLEKEPCSFEKKLNWNYVFIKDLDKLAKHKLIFTFIENNNI